MYDEDSWEPTGLRPPGDNAFALVFGCGALCIGATALGLLAWGLVAWL